MSKTFDQSKNEIARLCHFFTTNHKSFLAPGVNEAHIRQSLIDPFFEALVSEGRCLFLCNQVFSLLNLQRQP